MVRAYLVVADVDEDLAHDGVEFLSSWLALGRLDDETLERLEQLRSGGGLGLSGEGGGQPAG